MGRRKGFFGIPVTLRLTIPGQRVPVIASKNLSSGVVEFKMMFPMTAQDLFLWMMIVLTTVEDPVTWGLSLKSGMIIAGDGAVKKGPIFDWVSVAVISTRMMNLFTKSLSPF